MSDSLSPLPFIQRDLLRGLYRTRPSIYIWCAIFCRVGFLGRRRTSIYTVFYINYNNTYIIFYIRRIPRIPNHDTCINLRNRSSIVLVDRLRIMRAIIFSLNILVSYIGTLNTVYVHLTYMTYQ